MLIKLSRTFKNSIHILLSINILVEEEFAEVFADKVALLRKLQDDFKYVLEEVNIDVMNAEDEAYVLKTGMKRTEAELASPRFRRRGDLHTLVHETHTTSVNTARKNIITSLADIFSYHVLTQRLFCALQELSFA
jgi:hypothetical protein